MSQDDFPFVDTAATQMLSSAISRATAERGTSLRKIGAELNYRQAVVLSHMASGRVGIPIDRAEDFADKLQIPKGEFLAAVLKQRHPDVDWSLIGPNNSASSMDESTITMRLEATSERTQPELTKEQRKIIREVLAVMDPERHWLTAQEVPVMEIIRRFQPDIKQTGLDDNELIEIEQALSSINKAE